MIMKPEIAEALEKSIAHWTDNVSKAIHGLRPSLSPYACALCDIFNTHTAPISLRCKGCPVNDASGGAKNCNNTPYQAACDATKVWEAGIGGELAEERRMAMQEACQAELDFLISLRPVSPRIARVAQAMKDTEWSGALTVMMSEEQQATYYRQQAERYVKVLDASLGFDVEKMPLEADGPLRYRIRWAARMVGSPYLENALDRAIGAELDKIAARYGLIRTGDKS